MTDAQRIVEALRELLVKNQQCEVFDSWDEGYVAGI